MAARSLRRRPARREPKRRFTIFCEGEKTEPTYFNAIKRAYSSAMIAVEIVPGVGVPYTIAERAVEHVNAYGLARRSRRKKDSFEEGDQVWAVFDRDAHPRFNEAAALCEQNGIGVARSNPCFELWLILHVRDHDRPEDRHVMQQTLEEAWPEYDRRRRKAPDCTDLVAGVEQAERRGEAQLQRREDEDDPHDNPSTTVGRVTRKIREASESAQP